MGYFMHGRDDMKHENWRLARSLNDVNIFNVLLYLLVLLLLCCMKARKEKEVLTEIR